MVGMTSALGRALGYMGCGVSKAIASRNEVEARQDQPADRPTNRPAQNNSRVASQKQLLFIKSLAKGAGFDDAALHDYIAVTLNSDAVTLEVLSPDQATQVIDALKALPNGKAD